MGNTVISPDAFLINDEGVYEWTPDRGTAAWDRAYAELGKTLGPIVVLVGVPGSGKSTWLKTKISEEGLDPKVVFFDATNVTRVGRQPLIEIAREQDRLIEAVVFQCRLITCLRRNAERPPERRVPTPTMMKMGAAVVTEAPTLSEGFWRLTRVETG